MAAHQAPPSLGFSRQEHWSGLPFPSPMHESEKWKWSHSVVSDSSWPHGLQPTSLLHPWDFPGEGTGLGCHCLLRKIHWIIEKAMEFKKSIYFCYFDSAKAFDCVNYSEKLWGKKKKLWNILTGGNTRPPYLHSEKTVCRSSSNC